MGRHRRTIFDLFPSQIEEQAVAVLMKVTEGMRRDQHQTPRQPGPCIGDNIADNPLLIVEIEILDAADFAIGHRQCLSVKLFDAKEHECRCSSSVNL